MPQLSGHTLLHAANRESAYDCYKPSDRFARANDDKSLTHCKRALIECKWPDEIIRQQLCFELLPLPKIIQPRVEVGDRNGTAKQSVEEWSMPRRLRPEHGFAAIEAHVTNSEPVQQPSDHRNSRACNGFAQPSPLVATGDRLCKSVSLPNVESLTYEQGDSAWMPNSAASCVVGWLGGGCQTCSSK